MTRILTLLIISILSIASTAHAEERYYAVKTNLAYDAAALPNIDICIGVTDNITVDLSSVLSLWKISDDFALRTLAFQPQALYWFGGKAGKGHAAGINAGVAFYNFYNGDYRYQDTRRPLLSMSLAYTYALPIAKQWSLEFSLSVGYVNSVYDQFYNIDNGAIRDRSSIKGIYPTNIGINLCYSLWK